MSDQTELKRLAEAATPGPWRATVDGVVPEVGVIGIYGNWGYANAEANRAFIASANPSAVQALIAENDLLREDLLDLGRDLKIITEDRDLHEELKREARAKRDHLKAENAGLKTGYEAYEQVVQGLKAENEALREDLEQNRYDANAWRNREESVWIEVFNSDGDDPFISAVTGQITIEQLALIQAEILEYREDYFEKGSGLYVFKCAHYQAHYDNVGMTEPAHWETDFESYSPFPWEEEAAAMSKEGGGQVEPKSTETPELEGLKGGRQ